MSVDTLYEAKHVRPAVIMRLHSENAEESIIELLLTVQKDAYERGRLSVQNDIVNALNLPHLLGRGVA